MATVTTLRPSATSSGVGWSAVPSGALDDVTSDNNDATYALWSGAGSPMILATPLDSPPAGERRHLVRLRARGEDGNAWWAVRLASGPLIAGAAASFPASPSTVVGSWGAGAPPDGSTILSCYVTGQSTNVKINELFLDVDTREAPTFTAQILDGSGAVSTSISDTTTPVIRVNALDLDGLAARQYRFWVTLSGVIVWDTGIVSGSPVNRPTTPLANGSYVAHYQVWSTLGASTAYPSAEATLAFTISVGTVPAPAAPVVTEALPFFEVEVCAPDMTGFDNDRGSLEIQRVDCDGTATSIAMVGPLTTGQCGTWTDFSLPRSGQGRSCDHDPDACCSSYRVRSVGRISGGLLVSTWTSTGLPLFCLDWNEQESIIRTLGPAGPMWVPVLGRFEWDRTRPFTAANGVNGTRFVTSAAPGGRNLHMTAAVESEEDLADLHAVLARPLVLVSPSDAAEVWAAPIAESVKIIKIGRIRQVTADFIGTGPQPGPQLADVSS